MKPAELSGPAQSYVVTGGAQGVGRAIAERLIRDGHVVVLDVASSLDWAGGHRVELLSGNAADPKVAQRAADRAEAVAPLVGWVNNAAVIRDWPMPRPGKSSSSSWSTWPWR